MIVLENTKLDKINYSHMRVSSETAMSTKPLVSFLLSMYNGESGVAITLESIKTQTYKNIEIIIVNDGCTDNSVGLVEQICPHAKIIHQSNQGLAKALNTGLKYCKGKYIARIDCHDIALPHRIEMQVNMLEENPDLGAIGGHIMLYEADQQDIGTFKYPIGTKKVHAAFSQVQPVISHSAAMLRSATMKKIGGYDPFYCGREDFELWCRLSLVSNLDNVDSVIMRTLNTARGITYNATDLSPLMTLALYERENKLKYGIDWTDKFQRQATMDEIRTLPRTNGNPKRNLSIFYCKRAGAIYNSGERGNALIQYLLALKSDFSYFRAWAGAFSSICVPVSINKKVVSLIKKLTGKKIYN